MSQNDKKKDIGLKYIESTHDVEIDAGHEIHQAQISIFTPEEQKKIIHHIDRRLVVTLGVLYCVSLMDRNNTGIAMIAGMGADLELVGSRYSLVILLFFIPYILVQPIATVVIRKIGPRIFLPTIAVAWGVVMVGSAFVRTWGQMIPMRLILGLFEGGFFPGCAYLLSCWYPRYELQTRNALFNLIGNIASAFSGILSYGFSQMGGLGAGAAYLGQHNPAAASGASATSPTGSGISGWRWIFIWQGIISGVVGLISFFVVVDFPELATRTFGLPFLTQKEVNFVVARIEADRSDSMPEGFNLKQYLINGRDLKVWAFGFLFLLTTTNTYAIAYFLPIILKDSMGFSIAAAQCLIAPPFVVSAMYSYTLAWYADKLHIRSPFIAMNACLALIGLPLIGFVHNVGARYFGVFLATSACYANIPCILTWQANNIRGQWKRALSSAILVSCGGIGGIIGSLVFRSQDKPSYHPGIIAAMVASGLILLMVAALDFKFIRANKRAEMGGKPIEGLVGFKYTL